MKNQKRSTAKGETAWKAILPDKINNSILSIPIRCSRYPTEFAKAVLI